MIQTAAIMANDVGLLTVMIVVDDIMVIFTNLKAKQRKKNKKWKKKITRSDVPHPWNDRSPK